MGGNHCRSKYNIWPGATFLILIGCGVLIYFNYKYEGSFNKVCDDCKEANLIQTEKLKQEYCEEVCYSEECLKIAQFLIDNMNTSADPCEDFYSFSCGGLLEKYEVNESFSAVSQMEGSLKLILKGILEDVNEPQDSISKKMKTLYESCMSYNASESNAVPSALEFLSELGIRQWPHLKDDFSMDIDKVLAKLISYLEFFLIVVLPTDTENPFRKQGDLLNNFTIGAGYAVMRSESVQPTFKEIVLRILSYLNASSEEAKRIWKDFREIDSFILEINSRSTNQAVDDSSGYSCILHRNDSICSILNYVIMYSKNSQRYSTDFVYIQDKNQVLRLMTDLRRYSHRSIANYLALRFFLNHLDELDTYFKVLFSEYQRHLPSKGKFKFTLKKWEYCIEWLSNTYEVPLSKVYLNSLPVEELREISSIFSTTRQETVALLKNQLWIEDEKRRELELKMESMTNEIETFIRMDLQNVNNYIEKLRPTSESFLRNSLEYRKSSFKFLSANINFDQPLYDPFGASAYSTDNGAQLTFGLLQPPVFKFGFPKMINLATLSPILGHEFGHHLWNYFDELRNTDSPTSEMFGKKTKCLEDQFSKIKIKKIGENIQGDRTVSENLPDLVGHEINQKVIEKHLGHQMPSVRLPSITLSSKQLLYVLMTQMWCDNTSVENEILRYKYDTHTNLEARITNVFRNLRGFSEAFSCPVGSDMNPLQKCSFFEDNPF